MSNHLARALEVFQRRIEKGLTHHKPCAMAECVEAGGHCVTCRDENWPCVTFLDLTGGQAELVDEEDDAA